MKLFVSTDSLRNWAEKLEARSVLPHLVRERSFFVFLTPRRFNQKAEWAAEQRKSPHCLWRGVRAYDADDLEQWVESAPAGIQAWLGRKIGLRPEGVVGRAEPFEMSLKRSRLTQFVQVCHVGFIILAVQLGEARVEPKNVIFPRGIATWPIRFGLTLQPLRKFSTALPSAMLGC